MTATLAAAPAWCCAALRRAAAGLEALARHLEAPVLDAAGLEALARHLEAPVLDAAEPPTRDSGRVFDARHRVAAAEEELRELRLRGTRYY